MTQPPNGQPRKTNRTQPGDRNVPGPPPAPQNAVTPGPGVQQGQIAQPKVTPSLEVLRAEFDKVLAANEAKFTELVARGAGPEPLSLVHARIDSLIDSIAEFAGPNGPRWALMARLKFERQIAAELVNVGASVQRMQMAEGARYTPEMIRQLAAQTGLLSRRTH